eukprot:4516880-Alexandrium_andersonii.AAC.1
MTCTRSRLACARKMPERRFGTNSKSMSHSHAPPGLPDQDPSPLPQRLAQNTNDALAQTFQPT